MTMHPSLESQVKKQMAAHERAVKAMLCRWVSELEPAVAWQYGVLRGLTITNISVGEKGIIVVPVKPEDFYYGL